MNRNSFIERLRTRVSTRGHMSWILASTIATGILSSKLLLFLGLSWPMTRYGLSVLLSYAMFFLLVYLWIRWYFGPKAQQNFNVNEHHLVDVPDGIDIVDVVDGSPQWSGHGGQFSGGGSSGTWDPSNHLISTGSSSSSKSSDFGGFDLDEGLVLLLLIALIAAVSGSALYLVYQAPEILLEAAFEMVLAAGLLKKTREIRSEGWAYSVLKGTWIPFLIVLMMAVAFGYFLHSACPGAISYRQYREMCLGN